MINYKFNTDDTMFSMGRDIGHSEFQSVEKTSGGNRLRRALLSIYDVLSPGLVVSGSPLNLTVREETLFEPKTRCASGTSGIRLAALAKFHRNSTNVLLLGIDLNAGGSVKPSLLAFHW